MKNVFKPTEIPSLVPIWANLKPKLTSVVVGSMNWLSDTHCYLHTGSLTWIEPQITALSHNPLCFMCCNFPRLAHKYVVSLGRAIRDLHLYSAGCFGMHVILCSNRRNRWTHQQLHGNIISSMDTSAPWTYYQLHWYISSMGAQTMSCVISVFSF